MLIPQFSIRVLLAVTTACAVVFSIVGLAVRGSAWATAVSVGIGSLAILVLVSGVLFAVVWLFSVATSTLGRRGARSGGSPFRSELGGAPFGSPGAAGDGSPTPEPRDEVPVEPILVDEPPVVPEES